MRIRNLVQTCDACPSQWDAETEDGRNVYIRYRWGYLSVDVSGLEVFGSGVGSGSDGCMSTREMLQHTGIELI